MPPWERYQAQPQTPPANPSLAERGTGVTGAWGQRAAAQGSARVQQRQEQTGAEEIGALNTRFQLLTGLGRARRLIESDTPTGPMAEHGPVGLPGSIDMARALPAVRGYAGVPSTQQLTNLGELDKLSTLAATAVAGQTTTGMDANTRAAVRSALFNVDRSQGENRQNVNFLLQQYVADAVGMRIQQAWRNRYGDVNAVDPATGMNAADYMVAVRNQLPTYGPEFEDRRSYRTRVATGNGASIDLPELHPFIDGIVRSVRGELDHAESNAPATRQHGPLGPEGNRPRVGNYNRPGAPPRSGRPEAVPANEWAHMTPQERQRVQQIMGGR